MDRIEGEFTKLFQIISKDIDDITQRVNELEKAKRINLVFSKKNMTQL